MPSSLLAIVLAVLLWSAIGPYDYLAWFFEVFPVLVVLPILVVTYRRFTWTRLVYILIALHCIILMIGGHYTYARVPLFDVIRDIFDLERNHYDRVGHFFQGFVPCLVARELLIRTSSLGRGRWLVAILLLCCMGVSALYELVEWSVAAVSGESAEIVLATQGDKWDTQKDMLLAGIGAICALFTLSRAHDAELAAFEKASGKDTRF